MVVRYTDLDFRRKIWLRLVNLGDIGTCMVIEVLRVGEFPGTVCETRKEGVGWNPKE